MMDKTSKEEILESQGQGKEKKMDGKSPNKKFSKSKSKSKKNRFGMKDSKKPFTGKANDPKWYNVNPQLTKDVGSIPFSVFNGIGYDLLKSNHQVEDNSIKTSTVPGILIYKYSPWYGSQNPTSALNLTMRALYSFVRHVNSGRTNYEAPDLMIYIMAMDNIYLRIHEITRLLKLTYYYVLENRDIPERIFDALGYDLEDVVKNAANYRARLNMAISKANSFAVPSNFTLFLRRAMLGSVVLTDEPNRATQLIVPESDGYFRYISTEATGGTLRFYSKQIQGGDMLRVDGVARLSMAPLRSVGYLLSELEDELSVLLSDEDMNVMSGDIIKAYGNNLYTLPFLAENEIIDIVHDKNLLLQFRNSVVLDLPNATWGRTAQILKNPLRKAEDKVRRTKVTKEALSKTDVSTLASQEPTGFHISNFRFQSASGEYNDSLPIITQNKGTLIANLVRIRMEDYTDKVLKTVPTTAFSGIQFQNLNKWFLDANEGEISPEMVLEWTRLTMLSNEITIAPNNVTADLIEAGTEIGLGWLIYAPKTVIGSSSVHEVTHKEYFKRAVGQWMQFAQPSTRLQKIATDGVITSSTQYANKYMIYSPFTLDDDGIMKNTEKYYNYYNPRFTEIFMSGLSFGPKSMAINLLWIQKNPITGNPGNNLYKYKYQIDTTCGHFGEKTALIDFHTLRGLHDVALLGLISSPYVTGVKGSKNDK